MPSPEEPDASPAPSPRRPKVHFDRGSRHGTRSSVASGASDLADPRDDPQRPYSGAMLITRSSLGRSLHVIGRALKLSSMASDPRSHKEAMADDPLWEPAEHKEIKNHRDNQSWTEIRRRDLPKGRSPIKLVWAYL